MSNAPEQAKCLCVGACTQIGEFRESGFKLPDVKISVSDQEVHVVGEKIKPFEYANRLRMVHYWEMSERCVRSGKKESEKRAMSRKFGNCRIWLKFWQQYWS